VDDFDRFFMDHYARVVGSLRLAGGEVGEAEDAAQDAFAKAMVRWKSVSTMARPATWVYATLSTPAPLSSLYCPFGGLITAIAPRSVFTPSSP
jgi:hypothetical protein